MITGKEVQEPEAFFLGGKICLLFCDLSEFMVGFYTALTFAFKAIKPPINVRKQRCFVTCLKSLKVEFSSVGRWYDDEICV